MISNQILQKAATEGSLDSEEWPRTLEYILTRLDEIINDFPKPITPPAEPLSSVANTPSRHQTVLSSQESQTADKENAPPTTPPSRPPVPPFSTTSPQPSSQEPPSFPAETLSFYTSIRTTLSRNFAKSPPHTIQRLAELILQPKLRYDFLPPYLRALDRVISVSSPTTIFPLPQAVLPTAGGLLNGTTPTPPSTLGSDESLGGALLTPIPWLQNRSLQSELISESTEMVDGPHGTGRIETVSVMNGATTSPTSSASTPQIASTHPNGESLPSTGPVTQGELLRQEQEAGVVLSNPHSVQPNRTTAGEIEGGGTIIETVEGEEELPHARGPDVIGMEDTGPQRQSGSGLDIEAAVGRPALGRGSKSPGPEKKGEGEDMEGVTKTEEGKEDVDGKREEGRGEE
ncbi:hypothetical protein K469DRAFT_754964 [Zopfia rhizophila CBS 207.26]|uniref:PPP4R2-domain-containing protein n=1 Tax=Zopfia rhizophila CBS 207.26 TaxID=1314779 RepID=A0A6A6DF77_9PEZI|nr:hypothetical protein K469DRAFT_754964 [Zopfia rhizophila CBS 207.26]